MDHIAGVLLDVYFVDGRQLNLLALVVEGAVAVNSELEQLFFDKTGEKLEHEEKGLGRRKNWLSQGGWGWREWKRKDEEMFTKDKQIKIMCNNNTAGIRMSRLF